MEKVYEKLDELFQLLDTYPNLMEMEDLKKRITKEDLLLIKNYRDNPTIDNKKKIYENERLKKYLFLENEINFLIMKINKLFKRGSGCENH